MTEQTKKSPKGDPENAFKLSEELLTALLESELYKKGKSNPLIAFDIMIGIAEFSVWIVKALCISSNAGDTFIDLYMDEILPTIFNNTGSLEDLFKGIVEVPVVKSELN